MIEQYEFEGDLKNLSLSHENTTEFFFLKQDLPLHQKGKKKKILQLADPSVHPRG